MLQLCLMILALAAMSIPFVLVWCASENVKYARWLRK